MRRMNKWLALLCALGLLVFSLAVRPASTKADSPVMTGGVVSFDGDGRFVDTLDNTDHLAAYSGVAVAEGAATGPGELVYDAGSAEFGAISIDVTFNKWSLNYIPGHELSVYEAVYNDSTGSYVLGSEVPLLRELKPDEMTDNVTMKATYVSADKIAPGTRYLCVKLPDADNFSDSAAYADFQLNAVTLENGAAAANRPDYIIDDATGFSKLADGSDTSNLQTYPLGDSIWDARTFASSSYIERLDATREDRGLTYRAPDGKDFTNVYVEGYYNFDAGKDFEVWVSQDGTDYTDATQASDYLHPAIAYSDGGTNNWLPTVLRIDSLPAGTKYVQVRLPAFAAGQLYGLNHPRMTTIAAGYGEPADMTVTYPNTAEISHAEMPIDIDGVVETDADGHPAGDWQGASALDIDGATNGNGDSHSAKIYLKYDYDHLYVGAKFKDPTPMVNTNTGTNIWNGDNLEIFLGVEDLDYTRHPDKKNEMLPSDVQIVLSGGVSSGFQYYLYTNNVFTYPNVLMGVAKDNDNKGYSIEAAIPLSELGITAPWEGSRIIMNAVMNDGGSPSRGQWGWTTNGEPPKKSRGLWGLASFAAAPAPQADVTVNVAVDEHTNLVTVSGQTLSARSQDVTILVADPSGVPAYVDQEPSDAEGQYAFTFSINGDVFGSGMYTATVGGSGVARIQSAAFSYAPGEGDGTGGPPDDGGETATPPPGDGDGGTTTPPDDGDGGTATPPPGDGDGGTATPPDDGDGGTATPPPGDGDGGTTTPPDDGGGTATPPTSDGGTTASSLEEASGAVDIDLSKLQPDADNNLTVDMPQGASIVQMPADQAASALGGNLKIKSGGGIFTIPAGLLQDAAKLGNGANLSGAKIALRIEPTSGDEAGGAIDAAASGMSVAGEPIRIGISLIGADGAEQPLTAFGEPIAAELPFDTDNTDSGLVGVYFYDESAGVWEYAGGWADSGGLVAAEIGKPGLYRVLEYRKTYDDIAVGHWAGRAVEVLAAHHIMEGVSDRRFDPARPIARGEFAVMAAKALGLKPGAGVASFADVDPGAYYAWAVAALYDAKLVSGRGDNTFDPAANITREEMIAIVVRAYEYGTGTKLAAGSATFADDSGIAQWARTDVNAARAAGLVSGRGNNRFEPEADSARAETAQLIYNFLMKWHENTQPGGGAE